MFQMFKFLPLNMTFLYFASLSPPACSRRKPVCGCRFPLLSFLWDGAQPLAPSQICLSMDLQQGYRSSFFSFFFCDSKFINCLNMASKWITRITPSIKDLKEKSTLKHMTIWWYWLVCVICGMYSVSGANLLLGAVFLWFVWNVMRVSRVVCHADARRGHYYC